VTELIAFHRAQVLTDGVRAFAGRSLPDYDEAAALLVKQRVLAFLG
jgi:hypothetical protein